MRRPPVPIRLIPALVVLLLAGLPARADFVLNNLRFTLYHETAHAVIDQLDVALFGPEEVAADGFALVLADRMHDEATMRALIADVVTLGRADSAREVFDPWEDYMIGPQRLAWAVCVYYGLAPDLRADTARALGMPPARMPRCREAGVRLRAAWRPVLERLKPGPDHGGSFDVRLVERAGKALRLLRPDLDRLDAMLSLPRKIPLLSEHCGEDNAFYYHTDERIVFCEEMVDALRVRRRPGR